MNVVPLKKKKEKKKKNYLTISPNRFLAATCGRVVTAPRQHGHTNSGVNIHVAQYRQ